MTMTYGLRKFALTAHVILSLGLLGSIAAFLALGVAGLTAKIYGRCAPPIWRWS
jgi:hypothetical protein